MTLRPAIPLRILALCTPILATQALASAMNEYTLSPSRADTTVTTFQPAYQAQPTYQTQPAAPAAPQFGEIVYDSEPYMPDANTTESYTIQPYSGDAPLQPMPTYRTPASN